jgi:hypothetical protein
VPFREGESHDSPFFMGASHDAWLKLMQSLLASTAPGSIRATRRTRMIFSADTSIFALRLPAEV